MASKVYEPILAKRLLLLHAVDILQPDILLAGGFTGMLKIAAMAEPSFRRLKTVLSYPMMNRGGEWIWIMNENPNPPAMLGRME